MAFPAVPRELISPELAASALSLRQRPCQDVLHAHKYPTIVLYICFFKAYTIFLGLSHPGWTCQVMGARTTYPQSWLPKLGDPQPTLSQPQSFIAMASLSGCMPRLSGSQDARFAYRLPY